MNALRAQYRSHGFALVPRVVPPEIVDVFREHAVSAAMARRKHLLELPMLDNVVKQSSRVADPLYDRMQKHLERHRRRVKYARAQKRRRRGSSVTGDISGEDVWRMSQQIAAAVVPQTQQTSRSQPPLASSGGNSSGGTMAAGGGGASTGSSRPQVSAADAIRVSTVRTDTAMLSAINRHQVNLWMTHAGVEEAVRGAVGATLAAVARDVIRADDGDMAVAGAALQRPFLFADLPIVREAFGRPFAPTFAAPYSGIRSVSAPAGAAACAWLFLDDHDHLRMPVYAFAGSHRYVKGQYGSEVPPSAFEVRFKPMESHTPHHLAPFRFGPDVEVHRLPLVPKGSILVCDLHTMVGAGSNHAVTPTCIYRAVILDEGRVKPTLKVPSWTRDWRASIEDIPFDSGVVFPRLYR